VRTVPFDGRETNHLSRQPFGQVPFLSDGEVEIFESGAGLLHLARKSDKLMPRDPAGEAETVNGRSPRSTRSRWSPCRGGS
jgi:glutathione S-transferase